VAHQVRRDLDVDEQFVRALARDHVGRQVALSVCMASGVEYVVAEAGDFGSLQDWLRGRDVTSLSVAADIFASVLEGLTALHSLNLVAGDLRPDSVVGCSRTTGAVVWRPDARHARPCPRDGGADHGAADVLAGGMLAANLILRHVAISGFEREEPETATAEQRASVVRRACRRVATVSRALASCLRRCCPAEAAWRPSGAMALQLLRAARDNLTDPRNPNPELVAFLDFVFSAFTDAVGYLAGVGCLWGALFRRL
jgi:serine/threonine protein kinase